MNPLISLPVPSPKDLAHIPHLPRTPFVGHTLQLLKDPYKLHMESAKELGAVYKIKLLGQWRISFSGADAVQLILEDKDKKFSSFHGWDMIQQLFPGGLMLRDFDDHRRHRRVMQSAFRKPVMDSYRQKMDKLVPELIMAWPKQQVFHAYPRIKELSLSVGTSLFMGLDLNDPRVPLLNSAFRDELDASIGILRKPLPGSALRRGLTARSVLRNVLSELIPDRRRNPKNDFFSQMCIAQSEDGCGWTEEEVLDHFNFLLMAAHDTTASCITKIVWALANWPEWQNKLQVEIDSLGDAPFDCDMAASMELSERIFFETLRLMPPVPFIPRRTNEAFVWRSYTIPKGAWVSCLPGIVMMDQDFFKNPNEFDPDRFSTQRAEHKAHKYSWAPFGGGAHKCIGMHFAMMEAKIFLRHLVRFYEIERFESEIANWQRLPTPRPSGKFRIRLIPRN